jgi:FdhD protein
MQTHAVITRTIRKVEAGQISIADDVLAIEEPLEIQLAYGPQHLVRNVSITMRTPGNDEELAAGFLFTEGIIQQRQGIQHISPVLPGMNSIRITLHPDIQPQLQQADRNFYTTSSCGVCGKASIDAIKTVSPFRNNSGDGLLIAEGMLHGLQASLLQQQAVFDSTGGLHASGLFTSDGVLCMLREDVGRHNALDKVIGAALLQDLLPLDNKVLLLSGRASFELIQKAAMAGIKVVAAVGAPSSLAVELAQENNMTLVGFLRNHRFNIYCGSERIVVEATRH